MEEIKDFKSLLNSEEIKEMLSRRFNTVDTEDDDWFDDGLKYVIEEYNFFLFFDAIEFLRLNHVYFDTKTLLEIKNEFLEIRPISQEIKYEVSTHIDAYIGHYKIDGEPRKMDEDLSLDIDALYDKCIDLIWEISKDGKKSASYKNTDEYLEMLDKLEDDISDYLEMFNNSYDDISTLDIDIYHEDIRHLKFLTMLKCKVDGGGFDMIDHLDIRLTQEVEANCLYTIPV